MSATPQDVQAKLDAAVSALELTTVGYKNKYWKTPPAGSQWALGLAAIAAARAEAGQLVAPSPTPPPPPPPPPGPYTPQRWVYTLGDAWNGNTSSTGWTRDAASAAPYTPQRIRYDNTVDVMGGITGQLDSAHNVGACPTVAVEIDASDGVPTGPVPGAQGSVLRIDPGNPTDPAFGPMPDPRPQQGETWWYGWACETNPQFVPGSDPDYYEFNSFGLELHSAIGDMGQIMQMIATGFPATGIVNELNGAISYRCGQNGPPQPLPQPRIGIQLTAGKNDTIGEGDGVHTCRRAVGPPFVPGRRYKSIYQVHFDAFNQGTFDWWVDSGDGNGYVHYLSWANVSTLWWDASTGQPDKFTYPQMLNYRRNPNNPSAPPAIVYYGGYIRGGAMGDVVIP